MYMTEDSIGGGEKKKEEGRGEDKKKGSFPAHSSPCLVSEVRSPSHVSNLNRSASLCYHERSDSISSNFSGSNNQINSNATSQYLSDFSVRALMDLQYIKVSHVRTPLRPTSLRWQSICTTLLPSRVLWLNAPPKKRTPSLAFGILVYSFLYTDFFKKWKSVQSWAQVRLTIS